MKRAIFPASIRLQLTLWFSAALLLLLAFVGGLSYLGMQRGLMDGLDVTLAEAAQRSVISQDVVAGADATSALLLIRNAPARLVTLDGTLLQTDPAFPPDIGVTEALLENIGRGEAIFESVGNYRVHSAPVRVEGRRVAMVQAVAALDNVNNTLFTLRTVVSILLPINLLLAILGGWGLAGRALAPAERIRERVERIGASNLAQRVGDKEGHDEIGRLAHTFDGLLARVERAMRREQQFTSDASHELRTPLTLMKAEVGAALARPRSIEAYQATLQRLDGITDELTVVIEDLLTLARLANHPLRRERVDLAQLADELVQRLQPVAAQRGLNLRGPDLHEGVFINGDSQKLSRVLRNLLDNALRYTHVGDVSVKLLQTSDCVSLSVTDSGVGIAAGDLPHIFERFYRVASDRNRDDGGSGLGLSIVRALVEAHDGKIHVNSEVGVGTNILIKFPVA